MKKFLFFLFLATGLLEVTAQNFPNQIIYGEVEADAYEKISIGAFWKTRPEAKKIYEGEGAPFGFKEIVLEEDCFIRFKDGENNQFDRNYIVAPKGERVYTDSLERFFSAKCGNEIIFIRPVRLVEILPVVKMLEVHHRDTVIIEKHYYNYNEIIIKTSPSRKKFWETKFYKIGRWPIAIGGVGMLAKFLFFSKSDHHPKTGNPVDAPGSGAPMDAPGSGEPFPIAPWDSGGPVDAQGSEW